MSQGSLLAAPPDIVRWAPRSRGHGDCAVAALEMALGITYENALQAALIVRPAVLGEGLNASQLKKAAKLLGFAFTLRRTFDLDEDTGILGIEQNGYDDAGHAVYLWEGRILEPMSGREQLWLHPQEFLAHYHYQANWLLIKVEGD